MSNKLTAEEITHIENSLVNNTGLQQIKEKFQIIGCNCRLRQLIERFLNENR